MSKGKSEKGLVDWDEEYVSSEDEGVTRVKAFMAIAEDEPSVGKANPRPDYTHVDLYYVEDQRKKLAQLNLKKEAMKDEISDIKRPLRDGPLVKSPLTNCSLNKSQTTPEITSDFEFDNQEPLPTLSMLLRVEPIGTSTDIISLADLTLTTTVPKGPIKPLIKCHLLMLQKKTKTKSPSVPDPCPDKKADSSTKQLLLTLTEEVKGLKEKIKTPLDNSPSIS
nr:hypothetical protein [Tanacetum cinerariifolium]